MQHDPTAHAEMVVIRRLCGQLETTTLAGYTLYCTLQPCGMCTRACLWAGISRIMYGAGRNDVHAIYFESRHSNAVDFIRDAFRNDLQVEGEVLAEECARLYAKRQDNVLMHKDPAHTRTQRPFAG
jgi:tRNA(adenine34) deaminase